MSAQEEISIFSAKSFHQGVTISTPDGSYMQYEVPVQPVQSSSLKRNQHHDLRVDVPCSTLDPEYLKPFKRPKTKDNSVIQLRVYYELDYSSYIDLGVDINASVYWVNLQFSKVAEIYAMYNIELVMSEIFIWDSPDIYTGHNLFVRLELLGERLQNNFNGDAAQLLTTANIGGGFAHLDQLCEPYNPTNHHGPYSIFASMNPSTDPEEEIFWNVYGMAHELGHTIGAPHTHACLWGANQDAPLDDCYSSEGDCPPIGGNQVGTVMSYCHLNIGTDLDNGFGPVVGDYLRAKLLSKPCTNGECPKDKTIMTVDSGQPMEMATRTITSSATIPTGANFTFSASEAINFQPGFEVESQTSFETTLDGCSSQ